MIPPDGDDVSRAVDGDAEAVARVLAAVRPIVLRYCLARLGRTDGSYTSAEDVAQEVCLVVLRALPRFRDRNRPFVAFVYGIAARKVGEAARAARRRPQPSPESLPDWPDPADGPEQRALAADLSARLHDLLDRLPAAQREVVVLRVAVGLKSAEVASALGMSPATVRVIQHRALKRLRALAGDLLSDLLSKATS